MCRMSKARFVAHAASGRSAKTDSASAVVGSDSGSGSPSGMSIWWSRPGARSSNEAIIDRMGWPFWYAWVRRVENERPSWMRSTENVIGSRMSPGRREVRVHRMRDALRRQGALRRHQGLREHLPSEYPASGHPVAGTGEDVFIGPGAGVGEVERREDAGKRVAHDL